MRRSIYNASAPACSAVRAACAQAKGCKRWAIRGGTVCPVHVGSAPQVVAAATHRLQAMADAAANRLGHFVFDDGVRETVAVTAGRAAACAQRRSARALRQPSRQGDRDPLSSGTVKRAWDVLRRVLKHAVKHKAIAVN